MLRPLLYVAIVALSNLAPAQMVSDWVRVHDSSNPSGRDQILVGAHVTSTGSLIVVENVLETAGTMGDYDLTVATYDASGNFTGEFAHDLLVGPSSEYAYASVIEASTGELLVSGWLATPNGSGGTQSQAFFARFTSSGALIASLISPVSVLSVSLLSSEGAVYGWDLDRLTRYGSPAAVTWSRAFSLDNSIGAASPAPGGGVYVVGALQVEPFAMSVTRISPTNQTVWTRTLFSPESLAVVTHSDVDAAGNLYVGARYWRSSGPGMAGWLASFDPNGNVRWSTIIPTPAGATMQVKRVRADAFGRVLVLAGLTSGALRLYQYDSAGSFVRSSLVSANGVGTDLRSDARGNAVALFQNHAEPQFVATVSMMAMGFDAEGVASWSYENSGVEGLSFEHADALVAHGDGYVLATRSRRASTLEGDTVLARLRPNMRAYCFGDGVVASCPCANDSAVIDSAGCRNSLGTAGRLTGVGNPSIANDTLQLRGSGMTSAAVLYVQSTASAAATPFGDGLHCSAGTLTRLATQANSGGMSVHPNGGASVSIRGAVTAPGVRHYSALYRNAAPFCTGATFNLTNALEVTWTN